MCMNRQSSPFFAPQAVSPPQRGLPRPPQTKLNAPSHVHTQAHLLSYYYIFIWAHLPHVSLAPEATCPMKAETTSALFTHYFQETCNTALACSKYAWVDKFTSRVKTVWSLISPESGRWRHLVCRYILLKIWDVSAWRHMFIEFIIKVKPPQLYS